MKEKEKDIKARQLKTKAEKARQFENYTRVAATAKKATSAQMLLLAETMKNHPDLTSGYASRNLQSRAQLEREWEKLVKKLNSLGGPMKSVSKWKQAWRDMKNNVKKKAAHLKYRGCGPAGTGAPDLSVSAADDVSAIGPVPVFGLNNKSATKILIENAGPSRTHVPDSPELPLTDSPPPVPVSPSLLTDSPPPVGSRPALKRKGTASSLEKFGSKLIAIEEEKLVIKRQKNAALNRIADSLVDLTTVIKSKINHI